MERDKIKGIFTNIHEINNKLTAIIGISELMIQHWDEWNDHRKKEILEMVVRASMGISDEVVAIREVLQEEEKKHERKRILGSGIVVDNPRNDE